MMKRQLNIWTSKKMKSKNLITELNCFRWVDDVENNREYFGIQVTPTMDIAEAIKEAKTAEGGDRDIWVCGYYTNGEGYGHGEYHGLQESVLKIDSISI